MGAGICECVCGWGVVSLLLGCKVMGAGMYECVCRWGVVSLLQGSV